MMVIRLLCLTAALLVATLWWRWEKNPLQWVPPAAIAPDPTVFEIKSPRKARVPEGAATYFSMLDRPIFSPDRRPPAAIEEKAKVAEVDFSSNFQLLGLLTGQEYTGAVIRENGKVRRIRVSDNLGGWQLQSVLDREATFFRNGDTRVVKLVPARAGAANAHTADQGANWTPQSQASAPALTSPEDLVALENQKREEAKRENIRKRNVVRAAAGLPPVFD